MKPGFGRLLSILHRQAQVYINTTLKDFNITSAEYSFLLYLYRQDGATQDEMSSYLYIDKAATARAIKSLEQKGYIIRKKEHTDKRFNHVNLTNKARDYEEAIKQRIFYWSEFLTEDIDPETIKIVFSALEKMVDKVERSNLRKDLEEL